MTLYYAGVDTAEFADGFAVVVGGVASGTATVATGTYCAISLSAITTHPVSSGYTATAAAVQAALVAVNAGFTCTWSAPTLAFTIANASNFTLTWTGAAGTNLRRMLGFSSNVSSTMSAVSDVRPYYVISSEVDARSDVTDVYEPDGIVEEAVADGGPAFAVSKETSELLSDWVQAMEPLEATFTRNATAAVPWTWQHFFEHLRGAHPFAVVDNGATTVHQLRAEGAGFSRVTRERVVRDWDGLWNVRHMTRDLGAL